MQECCWQPSTSRIGFESWSREVSDHSIPHYLLEYEEHVQQHPAMIHFLNLEAPLMSVSRPREQYQPGCLSSEIKNVFPIVSTVDLQTKSSRELLSSKLMSRSFSCSQKADNEVQREIKLKYQIYQKVIISSRWEWVHVQKLKRLIQVTVVKHANQNDIYYVLTVQ